MIQVEVYKQSDHIVKFSLSGHAGYAKSGRDIVCAAVSALVLNAINSSERLLGVELPSTDDGNVLVCTVPTHERTAEVQLLLRSMLFGLEQTADECPKHLRVRVYQE
jgi:uncharacterized protein YsxB (DUF464 family)